VAYTTAAAFERVAWCAESRVFRRALFRAFFFAENVLGRVWESSHEYSIDGELRAVQKEQKAEE
jgi:hypothetical protein